MRSLFAPLCLVGLSCNLGVPANAPSSSEEPPGIASGTEVAVEVPLPPVQESEATRRLAFPASFQEPGAPPVAAPVVDEPVPPDGPRSPVFPQDQDAISWDTEPLSLYASLDAYCDAVQDRAAKRRESYETPVTLGPVGCFEVSPRVSFRAGGGFLALRALRVRDGEGSFTTLLAQRKEGLLAVPVSWDVDDPNDPGCGSIVRDTGLEEVTVQHDALVVVSLGERVTYVTDAFDVDSARETLHRSVMVVKASGDSFVGRGFSQSAYGGPELGFKLQPSARFTPWQNLPWKERQPVVVDSEGRLLFKGS